LFFFAAETSAKKKDLPFDQVLSRKDFAQGVGSFPFLPSSVLWNAEPIPSGSAEKRKSI